MNSKNKANPYGSKSANLYAPESNNKSNRFDSSSSSNNFLERCYLSDPEHRRYLDSEKKQSSISKSLRPEFSTSIHFFNNSRQPEFKNKFISLVEQWKDETSGHSSISKKLLNFSYLRIISMGEAVVPLILHELKQSPDHWFVALKAITNSDPVSPNASFDQAVQEWLKWGKDRNLVD